MFTRKWLALFGRELVALVCTVIAGILRCFEVLYLDWFISRGEIQKKYSRRIISNIRMAFTVVASELAIYKITVIFSGNLIAVGVFCFCSLMLLLFFSYNLVVISIITSRLLFLKAKSIFYKHIFEFWFATKTYLYKDEEYIKIKNRYLKMYSLPVWTSKDMKKDKRYKILKFDAEVKKLLRKKLRSEKCA